MDALKVSILFYEDREDNPPSHDEVVDQVADALRANEHAVALMPVYDDLRELLDQLDDQKPDLVFNLIETFARQDTFEMNITAVLVLMGVPFTGTGPAGLSFRQDKAVTKKLLHFHGVPCPNHAVLDLDKLESCGNLRFPLFVKPLRGDASLGIDDESLVHDYTSLIRRVDLIHNELQDAALVEEFIAGREFYVSVLGNSPPVALPLIEMDFSGLPREYPHIYGRTAKFDHDSVQFAGTNAIIATDLPPDTRARIIKVGLDAVYALQVRDYARVDIRLSPDGTPYVVEVNANPYLERTSALPFAALQAGMGYNTLINEIVDIAMSCSDKQPPLKGMVCGFANAKLRPRTPPLAAVPPTAPPPEVP